MWNYSFTVPCLLMLVIVLVSYFNKPRLPIRANRTFVILLAVQLLVMFFDIVSSRLDESYKAFDVATLYVMNTAYFVFYLMRIYLFFRLTLDIVHVDVRPNPWVERVLALPFVASVLICLSSPVTGLVFAIGEAGYASGPWYGIIYACSLFYILVSVGALVFNVRRLTRYEFDSALAFNVILLAGNAVRYLFPDLLVMDLFSTIAIAMAFLGFLNPDLFTTARGLAFNSRGFRLLMSERCALDDYHVLGVALQNYHHERGMLGGEQMDEAITAINEWMQKRFSHVVAFYLGAGRFALAGDGRTDWDEVRRKVDTRFQISWRTTRGPLHFVVTFAYVSSESGLGTADNIINSLTIFLDNAQQDVWYSSGGAINPMSIREVDKQVEVLRALERAVGRHEVEVFLQPVMHSATHELAGAEALARIYDEHGEIIPATQFIPIAEKSGHINRLGEQVLEKTCDFILSHDLERMGLEWINVNLSPVQCLQQDLVDQFKAVLERRGISPKLIHLEITEQSMVDYSLLSRQILALKDAGFQFVLDDYGTGYSNLTRARRYPFENIKLDMEVVWDYMRDRDELVPLVLQGFKQTGCAITAEGIETEEMATALAEIGSDYLQGFLFSPPIPMDEFVRTYGAA